MKITILCENMIGEAGGKTCLAEWGLSLFIQMRGINILFDTGRSDVYKVNAKNLGIDLDDTDFVVLSHRHWDHAGGLQLHEFQEKKKLVIHPIILEKIYSEQAEKLRADFEIVESRQPLEFAPNAYYLGEIPRKNNFEEGVYRNDKMEDDSAIVIKSKKGAIVISGCSHAGICNICEYAKAVTGDNIYAVIGGFHLFEDNKKTVDATIEYFQKEKIEHLYPMHCVDFSTLVKFHLTFGIKKLSTGDILEMG